MSNLLDDLVSVVVGSISGVANAVTGTISTLQDFFYVKVRGLSFVVLGSRQTGKTTLIEWLRRNLESVDDYLPNPTAAGGDVVPNFTTHIDENMRIRSMRDVGGEYAMWETDWMDLFRTAEPQGIVFLIDHTEPYLHKDALNFVMQMIDDEPKAARNLKAFFILVNKSDLWRESQSLDDILQYYRTEQKRLRNQAERLGFKWAITAGSIKRNEGVTEMMRAFFNILRPKPRHLPG
jgi:GTPase SAR1 family protein